MRVEKLRALKEGCVDKNFVLLGVEKDKHEVIVFDQDLFVVESLLPHLIGGELKRQEFPINDFRLLELKELNNLEINLIQYKVPYQIVYFRNKGENHAFLGNRAIFVKGSYLYHFNRTYENKKPSNYKVKQVESSAIKQKQNVKRGDSSKSQKEIIHNNTITKENHTSLHRDAKRKNTYDNDLSKIVRTDKSTLDSKVADASMHLRRSRTDKFIDDKPSSRENSNARYGDFFKY